MRTIHRLLLSVILITVLSLPGRAQLRYGFRFAGEFANASLSGFSDGPGLAAHLDNRSGFSGGLMLEYQFEHCGFAPDIALLYTRYNTRLALSGHSPKSFGRNFIEVPIHFKWKFWLPQTKNLFAPMIYTGPSLMFRTDDANGVAYTSATDEPLDYTDYFDSAAPLNSIGSDTPRFRTKAFQPGWDVGIGFDVINFIQLTAGYRFGLGNALATPSGATLLTNGWNLAANIIFDF